jgi:hypothetical protein
MGNQVELNKSSRGISFPTLTDLSVRTPPNSYFWATAPWVEKFKTRDVSKMGWMVAKSCPENKFIFILF